MVASWWARSSSIESPPNFVRNARATSKATTFSMTTLAAATALTSLRSYWLCCGSSVARSTLGMPRRSVEMGFIVPRTTTGMPLVMPPSSPPALFVGRTKPRCGSCARDASCEIGSCTWLPKRHAQSVPMPTSTALNAWMPITAAAFRESSRSSHCTQVPSPAGTPRTCASTRPPTVSLSVLARWMWPAMRAPVSGFGQ